MTKPAAHIELLNQVQSMVIEFANRNGISLQDQFGSIEAFKKFVVGLTFKQLVEGGVPTKQAYDAVFGDNSYESMFEQTWAAAGR